MLVFVEIGLLISRSQRGDMVRPDALQEGGINFYDRQIRVGFRISRVDRHDDRLGGNSCDATAVVFKAGVYASHSMEDPR